MRNRNVHVQLWLNRKEADALAHGAKKCGLTQSTYLRHLITGFVPKELPPPDYHAMMRQALWPDEQSEPDRQESPRAECNRRPGI